MKSCNRLGRGFTLIELLVVVITIGILASLAVPRFVKTVDERYRREAKDTLYELLAADGVYRQEHGNYTPTIGNLPLQDPNSRTNYPLTYDLTLPGSGTAAAVFRGRAVYSRKTPPATSDLTYDTTTSPPSSSFQEAGW